MTALAARWTALWRRQPAATHSSIPAWLAAWWRQFGNERPRLITAWSGANLAAFLPHYEYEDVDERKLLPIRIGLSDYIDALLRSRPSGGGRSDARRDRRYPDRRECYLPDLTPGAALLARSMPVRRIRSRTLRFGSVSSFGVPGTVDGLAQIVPRKTLRDLRQARSRTTAAGSLALEAANDTGSVEADFGELFRLHGKRWRERGEGGVLANPKVQAFHREAAPVLLECGLLRLYSLRVGGAVVAAVSGFVHDRRAYAYLGGLDPDEPRLSPGAQIIGHAITEAIRSFRHGGHEGRRGQDQRGGQGDRRYRARQAPTHHPGSVAPHLRSHLRRPCFCSAWFRRIAPVAPRGRFCGEVPRGVARSSPCR